MNKLYPFKFEPIIKETIWGGTKLKHILNKELGSDQAGESWEISGVQENLSVVSNGFLAGNNIQELIEIYMGDLVGHKVYEQFGIEFPLLIKFIDANADLSIQVHPDDAVAKKRHNSYGKTEMWYVIDTAKEAKLIIGFKNDSNKEQYQKMLKQGRLVELLNEVKVGSGDVFFLDPGQVHAIGSGVLLAEVQQTSDITYRIFDYDRRDKNGNMRELHTDLALDVINYKARKEIKTAYAPELNTAVNIGKCKYFTTNLLDLDRTIDFDKPELDSFIIYMCLDGQGSISVAGQEHMDVEKGETVLIPAEIDNIRIAPNGRMKLLEIYID